MKGEAHPFQGWEEVTDNEWRFMQAHPLLSASIAEKEGASSLAVEIIRQHHERPGRKGYPNGIEPMELAVYLAVLDEITAMTEPRLYRSQTFTCWEALAEVKKWCHEEILEQVIYGLNLYSDFELEANNAAEQRLGMGTFQ